MATFDPEALVDCLSDPFYELQPPEKLPNGASAIKPGQLVIAPIIYPQSQPQRLDVMKFDPKQPTKAEFRIVQGKTATASPHFSYKELNLEADEHL